MAPGDNVTVTTWIIYLDSIKTIHSRQTYNLMQMLGDIGGLLSILVSIFTIILSPFIQINFKFIFFKKLYLAKSK